MFSRKPKPARPMEQFNVPKVTFLCEQDGKIERELKSRLIAFLSNMPSAIRAYLVRVDYGDPQAYNVALCLRCLHGQDKTLLADIGQIFASLFGRDIHLDILFLHDTNENKLSAVCKPFYSASSGAPISRSPNQSREPTAGCRGVHV
jgi:hypothetical protein